MTLLVYIIILNPHYGFFNNSALYVRHIDNMAADRGRFYRMKSSNNAIKMYRQVETNHDTLGHNGTIGEYTIGPRLNKSEKYTMV